MTPSLTDVSRTVSHALRHEPWVYELELDDEGWVPVDQLLDGLHRLGGGWASVDRATLQRMVAEASKARHELRADRIRALYGHSVPGRIARERSRPPDRLYHGTSPAAVASVLADGLKPMRRQYVHLSPDRATAERVGSRKARPCAVLEVDAVRAWDHDVPFYRGNELVWLADQVPPEYLRVVDG